MTTPNENDKQAVHSDLNPLTKEEARRLIEGASNSVAGLEYWNNRFQNWHHQHYPMLVISSEHDPWIVKTMNMALHKENGAPIQLQLHSLDLTAADLSGGNFQAAMIHDAKLDCVEFNYSDLQNAVFDGSSMRSAKFRSANLKDALMSSTVLDNGNFKSANLQGANLHGASCQGANFDSANLEGAKLAGANFTGAKLAGATFKKRDFHPSRLRSRSASSHLEKFWKIIRGDNTIGDGGSFDPTTIFDGADLRDVKGFVANGQSVRGTQFSPRSNEPYSIVRAEYTGAMMFFHFAALTIFFVPFVLRTSVWVAVAGIQGATETNVIQFSESRSVLSLVLGAEDGAWGWIFATPAFVMLLYNIFRLRMTWWLSKVRDAEERSQRLPLARDYWWCYLMHTYFMRIVFWLAAVSFIYNLARWMSTLIAVP